jgi:hypothetical protein
MRQAAAFTMMVTVLLCLPHAGGAARVTIEPSSIVSMTPPAESEEATRYLAAIELPSSLSGATVDYAELKLGIRASVDEGDLASAPFSVDVYAMDTQWSAGSVGWTTGWDTPGGDYVDDTHSSFVSIADTSAVVSLDLTHVIQAWVDGDLSNFGVILKVPTASCCSIAAIEGSDPPPTVTVYYTPAEE